MEFFLAFIAVIIAIITGVIISGEFSNIASEKGYPESKYFWYCLIFGVVGYMMVIALPDRVLSNKINAVNPSSEKKQSSIFSNSGSSIRKTTYNSQSSWTCKKCGRTMPEYTGTCACGNSKSQN